MSQSTARQMEHLVRQIAEWGLEDPAWHQLLHALQRGEFTLPDLLKAKNEHGLDHMKRTV